jgi:hypothetical protein
VIGEQIAVLEGARVLGHPVQCQGERNDKSIEPLSKPLYVYLSTQWYLHRWRISFMSVANVEEGKAKVDDGQFSDLQQQSTNIGICLLWN